MKSIFEVGDLVSYRLASFKGYGVVCEVDKVHCKVHWASTSQVHPNAARNTWIDFDNLILIVSVKGKPNEKHI